LSPLAFEGPLAIRPVAVASAISRGYWRHLVDNRHRTVLVLKPDRDLAECEAGRNKASSMRASMTAKDLRVVEATNTLRRTQEEPMRRRRGLIPTLTLSDLLRKKPIRRMTSL
jgi:Zn-dependent M16 (insulinase) family peptidase